MDEQDKRTLQAIKHYQEQLEKYSARKSQSKLLIVIEKLCNLPIEVSHLEKTGVGRTVNALRKVGGEVGDAAKSLVATWKEMVVKEESNENQENDDDEDDEVSNSDNEEKENVVRHKEKESSSSRRDTDKDYHRLSDKYRKSSDNRRDSSKNHHHQESSTSSNSNNNSKKHKSEKRRDNSSDNSVSEEESSHKSKHKKRKHQHSDNESNDEDTNHKTKSKKVEETIRLEEERHKKVKKSRHRQDEHKSSRNGSQIKEKEKRHDSESDSEKPSEKPKPKSSSSKHTESETRHKHEKSKHRERESSSSHKHSKSESSSSKDKEKEKKKEESSHHHSKSKSEKSPEKSSSSSSKHKSKSKSSSSSTSTKSSKKQITNGIDSGLSFAEALGMCEAPATVKRAGSPAVKSQPSTSAQSEQMERPSAVKSKPERQTKAGGDDSLLNLLKDPNLEPLDINISSLLPNITPNYRPLGFPIDTQQKRAISDYEELTRVIHTKNQRTKVYSGNKVAFGKIPSLFDSCTRVLQDNIEALEYTGGVPYSILKPVLEKATSTQLYQLEHWNPYLIEDTDELWQLHCQKEFRNKKLEETESWREMYMRCLDEREARLKALTANIKQSQDKSLPVRTTKLAYVDSVVKPPRSVARKQAKNGTAFEKKPAQTPSSRLQALAKTGEAGKVAVPNPGSRAVDRSSSGGSQSVMKIKKAPLMAKTLSLFKTFRR